MQYLENACMMPDQYPILNDRESIKGYYVQLYNRGLRFTQGKTINTAKLISDSIGIERGEWNCKIDSTLTVTGSFLTQWHYKNGKWWIENEMSKTDKVYNSETNK